MGEFLIREAPLWPFVLYLGATLALVTATVVVSWLLGERHADKATVQPYESGVVPTGSARLRVSAQFYLMAMFFVVFDLEAAFIFAWAIAFRDAGWLGYLGILSFIGTLVIALIYLWRQGALDWGKRPISNSQHRISNDQVNGTPYGKPQNIERGNTKCRNDGGTGSAFDIRTSAFSFDAPAPADGGHQP